jgi:hypothetical protein
MGTYACEESCVRMVLAALFLIGKNWNKAKIHK